MKNLKDLLSELKRKSSGYRLDYDPRGKTHCACRAWFAETGPWFHGYGMSEEEAVEDCLRKIKIWWDVKDEINVGIGLSRRKEEWVKERNELRNVRVEQLPLPGF